MSSIRGVGQNLYQYLQTLRASGAQQSPQTRKAGRPDCDGDGDPGAGGGGQGVRGGPRPPGGGGGAMFKQIESAVTDALKSAQAGGSSSTTADPNKVVEDAIAKVLSGKAGKTSASTTAAQQTTTGNDPDGDGDTDPAGRGDVDQAGARQAFFQTLKSFGISPSQFRQDFMAAIKDAQAGQADPATAFQSFPPGTMVDTTA